MPQLTKKQLSENNMEASGFPDLQQGKNPSKDDPEQIAFQNQLAEDIRKDEEYGLEPELDQSNELDREIEAGQIDDIQQ